MKFKTTATMVLITAVTMSAWSLSGCSTYKRSGGSEEDTRATWRESMRNESRVSLDDFKMKDPSMAKFFDTAYGYAIFPNVGKGGIGVGGARGDGEVWEQGQHVGYAVLSQGTIGVQLGGQNYSEIVFFQDQAALDRFKTGKVEFSAQASAVAATKGASADADYREGVAVFTVPKGGLMFEATVGGQKFSYTPK